MQILVKSNYLTHKCSLLIKGLHIFEIKLNKFISGCLMVSDLICGTSWFYKSKTEKVTGCGKSAILPKCCCLLSITVLLRCLLKPLSIFLRLKYSKQDDTIVLSKVRISNGLDLSCNKPKQRTIGRNNSMILHRECVRTGATGAGTRRSLGHHLLHPLILRPRALFYRTDCTRRSKFLTHALKCETF